MVNGHVHTQRHRSHFDHTTLVLEITHIRILSQGMSLPSPYEFKKFLSEPLIP
jgi:hypothetical protein